MHSTIFLPQVAPGTCAQCEDSKPMSESSSASLDVGMDSAPDQELMASVIQQVRAPLTGYRHLRR